MKTKNKKTNYLVWAFVFVVIAIIGISISRSNSNVKEGKYSAFGEVEIFKSPSCGCCGLYVDYLNRLGVNTKITQLNDLTAIKAQFGVPKSLESCHTTKIGSYFVEGHIPIEAIEKLMSEKPDIKGIALPEMPSGSPGMPGAKQGQWIIYAVQNDESISEFMRI